MSKSKFKYIVVFDKRSNKYDIICKEVNVSEVVFNGKPFYYYNDGGATEDFIFDSIKEAIGKKNRMNLTLLKNQSLFYNGKIVWMLNEEYNKVKCIITDMNYQPIVPTFKIRPLPGSEFYEKNPDFSMTTAINELNKVFALD